MRPINPPSVHPPFGAYTHGVAVEAGAWILFVSGQVGARPDGSVPPDLAEQADLAFANLLAVIEAAGMGAENIVKLNTYIVAGQEGDAVRAARLKYLGQARPASTVVYVPHLVTPELLIEVEAVAAKR